MERVVLHFARYMSFQLYTQYKYMERERGGNTNANIG